MLEEPWARGSDSLSKTLFFLPFQANPMGGYTAEGRSPGEPWGGRGSAGQPWEARGALGSLGSSAIPRATRRRWKLEHNPICKSKPGQAVGEFRGQRSAKP